MATMSSAERLEWLGAGLLRWSLVFLLVFFGALKWAAFEADAVHPMIANSPFLFWLDRLFGKRGASEFIGVIELVTAALLIARRWSPKAGMIGGFMGIVMFLTTLSFLFTTPNIEAEFAFILKDVVLLGVSTWLAGEAWVALERTRS
jgi:uncharacterized membrane protein YkgB